MLKVKFTSSLEKPFADEKIENYPELKSLSALRCEVVSFQLLYSYEMEENDRAFWTFEYTLSGDLAPLATVRAVRSIGVQKPIGVKYCDNYLRTTPGLYPDVLVPTLTENRFCSSNGILNSLWIDVTIPSDSSFAPGDHALTLTLKKQADGTEVFSESFTVNVVDCVIEGEKTLYTQWIVPGQLSTHYGIKPWSKKHWEIIEAFVASARKNGMNVLFSDIFRNLVEITKTQHGYRFNFKKFDKWLAMANKYGYSYIEIPHLFTPGSVSYAEKVIYIEAGEKKSTSGMKANDPEYIALIRATLKALIAHMKKVDDDKRLLFHIADEPSLKFIDNFRAARDCVIDIIGDYQIIDAIFDIEFWREGLVTAPVPITDHIDPFLEENVPNLWTYYCTGPQSNYSNRFIAQSGACTRSLGMQLYKYNIVGFLHWALCSAQAYSGGLVDPFLDLSGDNWVPAGDTLSLYPAPNGTPYESMRIAILRDSFQDIRAMQTAEHFYSHADIVAAIEEELGTTLLFSTCAKSSEVMLRIRERINSMIKEAVSKSI